MRHGEAAAWQSRLYVVGIHLVAVVVVFAAAATRQVTLLALQPDPDPRSRGLRGLEDEKEAAVVLGQLLGMDVKLSALSDAAAVAAVAAGVDPAASGAVGAVEDLRGEVGDKRTIWRRL